MSLLNLKGRDQENQTLGHEMISLDPAPLLGSAQPPEDAPAGRASGVSASAGLDKDFVISVSNILQALICLSNLMSAEANDPAKVRVYGRLMEQRVQTLGKLICPMLWNPG